MLSLCGFALSALLGAGPIQGHGLQTTELHRATLLTPGGELVFGLRTVLGQPVVIENGRESLSVAVTREGERLRLSIPPYPSTLTLDVEERIGDSLRARGVWTKPTAAGEQTLEARVTPWPIQIEAGRGTYTPAYPLAGAPLQLDGRWRVTFAGDEHPAVGVFALDPERPGELTGTFLTTLGDYRYLAGTARGDELALSCFDGAHAFLFRARLDSDGTLQGDFWSGAKWHQRWTAVRDPNAALPDAFTLSRAAAGVELGKLTALALDGTRVELGTQFGRATLVQLVGTWCPNCGDAAALLRSLGEAYGERGLRLVSLAFEPEGELAQTRERVEAYRKARGVTWPVLLAGSPDKTAARAAFPALERIHAYPTTLFVDSSGAIRAVYTGFSGPATGAEHTALQQSFRAHIERLLAE